MSDSTLFVPIAVKALVVNDAVRTGVNFHRWKMNYNNLKLYASPEDTVNTAQNWNNTPSANGVYLQWTMPYSLRTGVQDSVSGVTDYPLVPNRWLVMRYQGPLSNRVASAWIIESDFLDPNEGTSPYIDPNSPDSLNVTLIGRKLDLPGWKESGSSDLFLTIVGAGDVTFASYQPNVENVFSIHDPLTDVTDPVLSYMVAGWYSDPTKDILAGATDVDKFKDILSQLKWTIDGDIDTACTTSVYQGLCYGLNWNATGPIPSSDKPDTATLAIGNTSIDAMTALIDAQAKGNVNVNPELLEAFQYNMLSVLDQTNGPELLKQAIHKAWFGSHKGGYEWVIEKSPDYTSDTGSNNYPDTSIDWNDPNLDPEWLAQLNKAQQQFDQSLDKLQSMQWNLYKMWWDKGCFDNLDGTSRSRLTGQDPQFTDENFANQVDVNYNGSVAQNTYNQAQEVVNLQGAIPSGATQEELQQSIDQYAQAHDLPDGYVLKRYSKDSFYQANDPVVLIAGAKASGILVDDDDLLCRYASQLITGFRFNGTAINVGSMRGKIPTVDLSNVPVIPQSLIDEFFFLDPNDATMIAQIALSQPSEASTISNQLTNHTDMIGTLPGITLESWQQPWTPLFLQWSVQYYPIPHDENGVENWTFDGSAYQLGTTNIPQQNPNPFSFNGIVVLTPQTGFNFKRRLDEFRKNHPNLDAEELDNLDKFIDSTDNWDLISQALDGFAEKLALLDNRPNVVPGASDPVSSLIGSRNSRVPVHNHDVPEPFQGWPPSFFQQYRSGQFYFDGLYLVDNFGQTLQITSPSSQQTFQPVIAEGMLPEHTVLSQEPYRFIQLPPRLLQPARLDFDFVSALDDEAIINLHSGINPVCAWVLPNHIDQALSCYSPEGIYLGELRVITNDQGTQVVNWEFAPDSPYTSINDMSTLYPHLVEMLQGLITAGPDAFTNFYLVIDETLWMVDPLGSRDDQNLSVLVGRPLALTRSRLKYFLNGEAITNPSWQYTFSPAEAEFRNYTFPIRLGELNMRNDGLVGYFSGTDYSKFNCVHLPEDGTYTPANPPYIQQVGNGNYIDLTFRDDSEAYITMLIDPRASVHATMAFLPVTVLDLPAEFVEPAMSAMDVLFHVGPLLSSSTQVDTSTSGDPVYETSIIMPSPSEKNGVWSWMENNNGWASFGLSPADQKANFSNQPSKLRTGYMKLDSVMSKKK